MFKKIILGIILFLGLSVLGIFIFESYQKPKFGDQLSDRSKKFIESQSEKEGASQYAPLLEEERQDTRGQRVQVGDCFSFIMPFSVFNSRQEGECNGYFAFDRPKGTIVAYVEDASGNSIEQASGFRMREQFSDKYQKKEYKIGSRSFVGFIDTNATYSITIYHLVSDKYFIFTLNLPEEDENILREILASLEFN